MSDIEMRDLKPNQDYSLDQQFLLFAWDFNKANCYGSPGAKLPPTNNCEDLTSRVLLISFLFMKLFESLCCSSGWIRMDVDEVHR